MLREEVVSARMQKVLYTLLFRPWLQHLLDGGLVLIGIIAYYDTTITNRDHIYHFSSLGVFVILLLQLPLLRQVVRAEWDLADTVIHEGLTMVRSIGIPPPLLNKRKRLQK